MKLPRLLFVIRAACTHAFLISPNVHSKIPFQPLLLHKASNDDGNTCDNSNKDKYLESESLNGSANIFHEGLRECYLEKQIALYGLSFDQVYSRQVYKSLILEPHNIPKVFPEGSQDLFYFLTVVASNEERKLVEREFDRMCDSYDKTSEMLQTIIDDFYQKESVTKQLLESVINKYFIKLFKNEWPKLVRLQKSSDLLPKPSSIIKITLLSRYPKWAPVIEFFDLEDYSDEIKTEVMDLISLFKIADSINVKQQIKLTDIESTSLFKEVFDRMLIFFDAHDDGSKDALNHCYKELPIVWDLVNNYPNIIDYSYLYYSLNLNKKNQDFQNKLKISFPQVMSTYRFLTPKHFELADIIATNIPQKKYYEKFRIYVNLLDSLR